MEQPNKNNIELYNFNRERQLERAKARSVVALNEELDIINAEADASIDFALGTPMHCTSCAFTVPPNLCIENISKKDEELLLSTPIKLEEVVECSVFEDSDPDLYTYIKHYNKSMLKYLKSSKN